MIFGQKKQKIQTSDMDKMNMVRDKDLDYQADNYKCKEEGANTNIFVICLSSI